MNLHIIPRFSPKIFQICDSARIIYSHIFSNILISFILTLFRMIKVRLKM
ncbi:hypothetical protein NT05HA_0956 [Aggregatibacter aphrophilus NJ8700]|nr:hypothetical protein NT05HA_0956 [Aggregatibacter aphrophilus NJ8700]